MHTYRGSSNCLKMALNTVYLYASIKQWILLNKDGTISLCHCHGPNALVSLSNNLNWPYFLFVVPSYI